MADAARHEDEPDRESLRQAVVEVHRTAYRMLYAQRVERLLLMHEIVQLESAVRNAGGRDRGKDCDSP